MSVKQIIKESMDSNPIDLKALVEEELRLRIAAMLEAKMTKNEDDDEDDDEDEDED